MHLQNNLNLKYTNFKLLFFANIDILNCKLKKVILKIGNI